MKIEEYNGKEECKYDLVPVYGEGYVRGWWMQLIDIKWAGYCERHIQTDAHLLYQ